MSHDGWFSLVRESFRNCREGVVSWQAGCHLLLSRRYPPPPGFPAKKNAATAGEPATSNKRALTGYDSDSDGDEGVKRRRDLLATPAEMPLGRTGTVLDLDEAVGKVQIVDKGGLTGFRCDLCEMSFLDSTSYLNHIDGPNRMTSVHFASNSSLINGAM